MLQGGRCLYAPAPRKAGSEVNLGPCHHEKEGLQWTYDAKGGMLRNRHGVCLDDSQASFGEDGDGIHLWWCYTSLRNQQWAKDDMAGLVRNRHGLCLDVPLPYVKGSKLRMARCSTFLPSQHLRVDEASGAFQTQYGSCLGA